MRIKRINNQLHQWTPRTIKTLGSEQAIYTSIGKEIEVCVSVYVRKIEKITCC